MPKSLLSLPLVIIVLLAGASALPAAPALDGAAVSLHELPNGLRMIVKEEHATNLVAIALYVKAGSITEQGWPDGISRFVEELVFGGPDESRAADVRERLELLGADLSSSVTRDFTRANVAVASPYLRGAMDELAKLVVGRTFPPTIVHEVRQSLLRDVEAIESNPRAVQLRMSGSTWNLAFREHPYGKPLGGSAESLAQIDDTRAAQYYSKFYVPSNMTLLIAGDTTPDEAVAAAKGTLGRMPPKNLRWVEPEQEPRQTSIRTADIDVQAERHAIMMAFHGPGIEDRRDVCAMDVIYTVLGQGEQGRLTRVLQNEKEVIVSADVEFITRRNPGLLIITCVAANDRDLGARAGVLEQLRRLADEPLSDEELAAAKKLLRDAYAFSNETLMDQTGSMGFYDCIDTYQFAIDYIAEVDKVTARDVQRTARRYLRPEAYSLVTARPTEAKNVRKASL